MKVCVDLLLYDSYSVEIGRRLKIDHVKFISTLSLFIMKFEMNKLDF